MHLAVTIFLHAPILLYRPFSVPHSTSRKSANCTLTFFSQLERADQVTRSQSVARSACRTSRFSLLPPLPILRFSSRETAYNPYELWQVKTTAVKIRGDPSLSLTWALAFKNLPSPAESCMSPGIQNNVVPLSRQVIITYEVRSWEKFHQNVNASLPGRDLTFNSSEGD